MVNGQTSAALNIDVLKALVGDATVTDSDEKYGLNWHGKRKARQIALTPSTGTLRPAKDESVDWDTTQNLMIEGDNPGSAQAAAEELCRQGQADLYRPAL